MNMYIKKINLFSLILCSLQFFMDDCLQRLIDIIDSEKDLKNLIPSERISKLVRIRLEMQAPYITKWPQALSIQVPTFVYLLDIGCLPINPKRLQYLLLISLTGTTSEFSNKF